MRILMAAVALWSVVGCASGAEPPVDPGPCQARSGLYRVRYVATSGNCGAINEGIINVDAPAGGTASGNPGCTGTGLAFDACDGDVDLVCPLPGSSNSLGEVGTIHFAHDGSGGRGTLYLELKGPSGAVLCNGIYSVAFSRP